MGAQQRCSDGAVWSSIQEASGSEAAATERDFDSQILAILKQAEAGVAATSPRVGAQIGGGRRTLLAKQFSGRTGLPMNSKILPPVTATRGGTTLRFEYALSLAIRPLDFEEEFGHPLIP